MTKPKRKPPRQPKPLTGAQDERTSDSMQPAPDTATAKAPPPRKPRSRAGLDAMARAGMPATGFATMSRPIRRFCESMAEIGDIARAYMESHPGTMIERIAKYRGSQLLKRGEVRAYIAQLKAKDLIQGDIPPAKSALLAELDSLAYARVPLGKLHAKEKLMALRTIAEINGWMSPKATGQGIRATFNFRVGGQQVTPGAPAAPQGITVDAEVLQEPLDAASDDQGEVDAGPKLIIGSTGRAKRALFNDDD